MTSKLILTACAFFLGLSFQSGMAGTIKGGFSGCDVGFRFRCEWEPSSCFKPSQPSAPFVLSVDDYNYAVDEYNDYVDDAKSYLSCVGLEADGDIRKIPALISESVDKLSNEIVSEVDDAKRDLDTARLFLRR